MTPPRQYLEDASRGEILRVRCEACGIVSDLIRLPAPIRAVIDLIRGFERGHAACGKRRP